MGIFSAEQTTSNQTAFNNQVGVSNRDLSGQQITGAANAVTGVGSGAVVGAANANTGGQIAVGSTNAVVSVTNQNLDITALNTAAATINHAIEANRSASQESLQGFQSALSVVSEHQQSAATLATGQQTSADNSLLGKVGLSGGQLAGIVIAGLIGLYFTQRR
jgi:hypothetical protein